MPGQFYDSQSGLFYNWNRYYNPAIGRYISSDPIGLQGGLNTFNYVEASPVMYTDPEGLQGQSIPVPRIIPIPGLGTILDICTPHNETCETNPKAFGDECGIGVITESRPHKKSAEESAEHTAYSSVCKTPTPPNNNPDLTPAQRLCEWEKENLNRLETCLQMRIDFQNKWYPNSPTPQELITLPRAINNAKARVLIACGSL